MNCWLHLSPCTHLDQATVWTADFIYHPVPILIRLLYELLTSFITLYPSWSGYCMICWLHLSPCTHLNQATVWTADFIYHPVPILIRLLYELLPSFITLYSSWSGYCMNCWLHLSPCTHLDQATVWTADFIYHPVPILIRLLYELLPSFITLYSSWSGYCMNCWLHLSPCTHLDQATVWTADFIYHPVPILIRLLYVLLTWDTEAPSNLWALLWENRSSEFPIRSDTNRAVQPQKMTRDLKFWLQKVEERYYPSSENKGADQLRGYRGPDLAFWFCNCKTSIFTRRGS